MVAAKNAGRAGSLLLGMALLALSGSQWVSPARADEPAKELSAEEHDRLLKEAADLDGRAGRLIQKGDRAAAVDLLQQLLAVRRGLYLADKSPEAQRELARVLNNLGMMQESVGKYADAADSLQKALDTYRDLYPRDNIPTATPLSRTPSTTWAGSTGVRGSTPRRRVISATPWTCSASSIPTASCSP